jgi:hypothetical protein
VCVCATCFGLYLGRLEACQHKNHKKGVVSDCAIIYECILLIVEHNGDVSPKKREMYYKFQRVPSYSHIFIMLEHKTYNVKVLYKTYRILKCIYIDFVRLSFRLA